MLTKFSSSRTSEARPRADPGTSIRSVRSTPGCALRALLALGPVLARVARIARDDDANYHPTASCMLNTGPSRQTRFSVLTPSISKVRMHT